MLVSEDYTVSDDRLFLLFITTTAIICIQTLISIYIP